MLREFKVVDKVDVDLKVARLTFERINADLIKLTIVDENGIPTSLNVSAGVDEVVSLKPVPPAGFKVSVDNLMIKFSDVVTLLPNRTASISLRIPADLGVYVNGVQISKVPLSRVKYALYGPPDLGVLCRFVSDEIVAKSLPQALGVIKLVVSNAYKESIRVGKVVLPLEGLGIYVTEENAIVFNSINVNVSDPNYAEVVTDVNPSLNNVGFKQSFEGRRVRYVMLYGLV